MGLPPPNSLNSAMANPTRDHPEKCPYRVEATGRATHANDGKVSLGQDGTALSAGECRLRTALGTSTHSDALNYLHPAVEIVPRAAGQHRNLPNRKPKAIRWRALALQRSPWVLTPQPPGPLSCGLLARVAPSMWSCAGPALARPHPGPCARAWPPETARPLLPSRGA